MSILAWIILGGFTGWLASVIMGTNQSMGIVLNVVSGVVGAFLGGWIYSLFGGDGITGFNWYSFMVATVGAIVFISILKLVRK